MFITSNSLIQLVIRKLNYRLRRIEEVGGFRMWVLRDHVAGTADYRHPKDPDHWSVRGVFPYVVHDGRRIFRINGRSSHHYLNVFVRTGPTSHGCLNSEVVLNAQGVVATRGKGIESRTVERIFKPYNHIVSFEADAEWYDALKALRTAEVAVVRFTHEASSSKKHFDYPVPDWNKRLVADVLSAFESLVAEEARVAAAATSSGGKLSATDGHESVGPFELGSDGSIGSRDNRLRVPPAVAIGEFRLDGFRLECHPAGDCIITDPEGRSSAHRFRGGRWHRSPAEASR